MVVSDLTVDLGASYLLFSLEKTQIRTSIHALTVILDTVISISWPLSFIKSHILLLSVLYLSVIHVEDSHTPSNTILDLAFAI